MPSPALRLHGLALLALLAGCGADPSAPGDASMGDVPLRDVGPSDVVCLAPDGGTDVPAVPTCCDEATCAQSAARCNPQTCRCEWVPCETLGAPCPAGAIPGITAPLVCAQTRGGRFCLPAVERASDCPVALRGCDGGPPCVCGAGSCRYFLDRCADALPCIPTLNPIDIEDTAFGLCRGTTAGFLGEGTWCNDSSECEAELLCVSEMGGYFCMRPDCGFAEGAPSCPAGRICRPFSSSRMLGACRVPCDPWDVNGPCGPAERCLPSPVDGRGTCVRSTREAALPARDEICLGLCRTGLSCVDGRCVPGCNPRAPTGTPGACPAGWDCIGTPFDSECLRRCDPLSREGWLSCPEGTWCRPYTDDCGHGRGRCERRPAGLATLGAGCFDTCAEGLLCTSGRHRVCKPICVPEVLSGEGACAPGLRCVRRSSGEAFGFCAQPCVAGDGTCPAGTWCEPAGLDPATNRWTGYCA